MCGVLGYVGTENAYPILINALKQIAYRGYDSSGFAVPEPDGIYCVKIVGSPATLEEQPVKDLAQTTGIGHTRWATHGEPSDLNAHPQTDCTNSIAVVHNGIIENYSVLKAGLLEKGHRFASETDSEVIPHLIEEHLGTGLSFEAAVRAATASLDGSFAFAVLHSDEPEVIIGARRDCPLIVGRAADGSSFLTSDIAAIVEYCNEVVFLEDDQMAIVAKGEIVVRRITGEVVDFTTSTLDLDVAQAQRDGYPHFMLKEIHEQPATVRSLLRERLTASGETRFPELNDLMPSRVEQVVLAACGTASYACAFGKVVIEELTGLPVLAEIGSEFRYRRHFLNENSLVVVISQSGETADTIAALRAAKEAGAPVLGVVNVMGTTVAREADRVVYTRGGPEAAVPSTKVFLNQLVTLELLALDIAARRGEGVAARAVARQLVKLPALLEEALTLEGEVQRLAARYSARQDWFVIGRGLDEALAREGALKLKEVAYLHAESIAAGELKHGPIALVDEGMPVLALVSQPRVLSKMANNIQEIAARRGSVIAFTTLHDDSIEEIAEDVLKLAGVSMFVDPIVMSVPLQLLSYYCGVARDTNIDYPRNLAKSVTVE